jgi:hypothetical protein
VGFVHGADGLGVGVVQGGSAGAAPLAGGGGLPLEGGGAGTAPQWVITAPFALQVIVTTSVVVTQGRGAYSVQVMVSVGVTVSVQVSTSCQVHHQSSIKPPTVDVPSNVSVTVVQVVTFLVSVQIVKVTVSVVKMVVV